jgi:hypothetical protein
VDQLIREKEYEDAISLCDSLTNFDETLKARALPPHHHHHRSSTPSLCTACSMID